MVNILIAFLVSKRGPNVAVSPDPRLVNICDKLGCTDVLGPLGRGPAGTSESSETVNVTGPDELFLTVPLAFKVADSVTITLFKVPNAGLNWLKGPKLVVKSVSEGPKVAV